MKSSKSSNLFKDTLSKLLRKPSGKTSRNGRQDTVISSKVVPIASSSDSRFNSEDVYDPVAEWKTGPVQHHPGASDAEVASHLDALGWEQSAPGDNQTAQYWQFTPQDDNGDITSVTSHRSNDADLASDSASQLRTPARRSEQPGRPHQQHTPLTNDGLQADSRLSVLSDSCPQDGSSPLHADSPPPERNEASLVCEEHHHYVQPHSQQRQQQRQVLPYQSGQLAQQMDHEPAYRQHASQPQQEMQIQQSLPAGPQLLSQPPSMAWQRIPTPELSSAAEPTLAKLPLPASYRTAAASLSGKAVPQHQLPEPAGTHSMDVVEAARMTSLPNPGDAHRDKSTSNAQPAHDRQSTFPRPDDSSASPSRWGSEARQKPPLPSPRRPPAPPSPYNRSTPAAQPSNPYQGRSTLRHTNHALQANTPRQSSLGYLINTPSELDHMDSAKWKSQLEGQHVTSSSAHWLDANDSHPSQQGNLTYPTPGITQQASSMPDSMGNSQVQGGMPGSDQRTRSNIKLGTARTSRSGRSRGPGSRAGSAMGSAASAWAQSHSAHQLAANVKALAAEVVNARSKEGTELAVVKLYAVLSQAHFVKQQAADWEGAFLGILALPLPLLLTNLANVLAAKNPVHSKVVRGMAAATLKSVAVWVEGQMEGPGPCQALVQQVLQRLVHESNPHMARLSRQGPSQAEDSSWHDPILPTRNSIFDTNASGTELLDTGTLDGLLDDQSASTLQSGGHDLFRKGILDTSGLLGSSMLESSPWQSGGQQMHSACSPSLAPSMLSTAATCMALNTQDVTEYGQGHHKGLRATFWLFKTDQEDAWFAAASLVSSLAKLGEQYIDAMEARKLVKPLFLSLRAKDVTCRAAALRALHALCIDSACRAVIARQDSYLQALVRAVQHTDASLQIPAVQILACLIAQDPSTHYVCAEAGLVTALGKLMKRSGVNDTVMLATSEALKHLTASSQGNRNSLVASGTLPHVIQALSSEDEGVQYNTARTLRHLALGNQPAHKAAAMPAITPLTQALQTGRPRVQFACASALTMLVEGHPEACPLIQRHGGIQALASMLHQAGAQAKKAAAEALQALAAEDVAVKPEIAKSGALAPLVQMAKTGNLQQKAAAAGALQALAYCPGRLDISAGIAAEGGVQPLVQMASEGPLPLRSAAAGALCNLALASPHNQAAIVEAGAIPALIEVVEQAQPDGQYAAAAALYNLAGRDREVRLAIMRSNAVPALVQMLHADSWYCRIVAAEVFGRLTAEWGNREAIEGAGAVTPLLYLLHLEHSPGMLDSVEGPVHHVAYERGQDVIIMKGYKFAKAKTAAAAMLGCLALANPATAAQLFQAGVAEELLGMLESSSAQARAVACACLGDLAQAHPPVQLHLSQGSRVTRLVKTMMQPREGGSSGDKQPDVAAAAACLGVLVANQPLARGALLQQGALPALLTLLQEGSMAQQSVAANVLFDMTEGSGEARTQVDEAGLLPRVHHLVASTNPPAVAAGGATAALLQATALLPYAGFAVTAKPSVNLLVLLQIPFEELGSAKASKRAPSVPLPSSRPVLHPTARRAASFGRQPEESSPSLLPQPKQQDRGDSAFRFASWSGSLPASAFDMSTASQAQAGTVEQSSRQEQWALPEPVQHGQQAAQQQILDTYLG